MFYFSDKTAFSFILSFLKIRNTATINEENEESSLSLLNDFARNEMLNDSYDYLHEKLYQKHIISKPSGFNLIYYIGKMYA